MLGVELLVLLADDQVKQLLAQALESNHEVDYLYFRCCLGQVVRIRLPRSHVQSELICIVDIAISKLDLPDSSYLEDLLE